METKILDNTAIAVDAVLGTGAFFCLKSPLTGDVNHRKKPNPV
jgi:hypothetical protein